ncbi:MAG: hypothetical protein JO250_11260 [Armatimonadetes bacterium]|nr:hypothetical protein [Armatimonadota bacterium]
MRTRHHWQGVLAAAACLCAVPARAQELARSADSLVDSIGVVTHWGYGDTPYGYAYDRIKRLLGESGIRHIRDGYHPREDDLYRTYGIQTTVIFGPGSQPPAQQVQVLHDHLPLADMIEGPNEVDLFPSSANYNGQGFPQGPKNYQHDLYTAVKADPALARVPVISFSLGGRASAQDIAPETDFDFEVMHSYAGGQMPSLSLESQNGSNIVNANRFVGPGHAIRPIVATESGYHTALGGSGVIAGVQPGVSEATQAKYLPRQFCEYFNHGIARDFTYEFADEFPDYKTSEREGTNAEACFGIIRHDLTPKPAYSAEKNLIALLNEATWDRQIRQWHIPRFQPSALTYTLTGETKNVYHTLLQKSNGDFYLLLWQEVPSFDTVRKQDIINSPVAVTLTAGTPIRSAAVYRPGRGTQAIRTLVRPKRLALAVPDEVLAVRLTPARRPRTTLPAPADPAASTTGTSATLTWRPVPGAAGYFVGRMGQFLGRTARPRFTDEGLMPATGYTYTITAYNAAGVVSPAASAVAMTKSAFPDLTPTALTWTPASPKAGDTVTFSVTVKNQGNAPTLAGTILGVAFQIDGANVNWSDTFRDALVPGQSRTLTANNGVKGAPTWTATPGRHTVTAIVDDINRITERSKANNTVSAPLDVGNG